MNHRDKQRCPQCDTTHVLRMIGSLTPVTRDSFGLKNEFTDPSSGQTIDSWKKWEKAGYRQPKDVKMKRDLNVQVKEKMSKIKGGV